MFNLFRWRSSVTQYCVKQFWFCHQPGHRAYRKMTITDVQKLYGYWSRAVLFRTTPNKPQSLTRNPWHVREYTREWTRTAHDHKMDLTLWKAWNFWQLKSQRLYCNQQSICQTDHTIWHFQSSIPSAKEIVTDSVWYFNRLNQQHDCRKNTGLNASLAANDFVSASKQMKKSWFIFIGTKWQMNGIPSSGNRI